MKKRIGSLLLAAMIVALIPGTAFAKTYGGEFYSDANRSTDANGNNYICTWIFDEASKTLYIEGAGAIPEYNDSTNKPPWVDYRSRIEALIIEEGITHVGKRAFQKSTALTAITFPSTLKRIYKEAFGKCTALESVTIPSSAGYESDAFPSNVIINQ